MSTDSRYRSDRAGTPTNATVRDRSGTTSRAQVRGNGDATIPASKIGGGPAKAVRLGGDHRTVARDRP